MAKKGHSDLFTVRFDPRIVELVRLLARETAREVIERSLTDAEARKPL